MFLAIVFLKALDRGLLHRDARHGGSLLQMPINGRAEQRVGRQQRAARPRAFPHQSIQCVDVHEGIESGDVVQERDDGYIDHGPLLL